MSENREQPRRAVQFNPGRFSPGQLNEDWLATIVGLALLALVLVGAIPGWLVP